MRGPASIARPYCMLGLAALAAIALAILYRFDPLLTTIFPPCPFHHLTGYYCPGCGALRAVHRLLNGDLSAALAMNPLLVTSIPLLALLVVRPEWSYHRHLPLYAATILILFAIFRNLPTYPFTMLAPVAT